MDDAIEMMVEYLCEKVDEYNVGIYELPNIIMAVGELHSGLAIYNEDDKLFKFFIAETNDTIFSDSDDEIYEEVELPEFIKRIRKT